MGYLKGQYKSESSLMTCEAELHSSVTQMPSSTLSLIGSYKRLKKIHLNSQIMELTPVHQNSGQMLFNKLLPAFQNFIDAGFIDVGLS